MYEFDQRAMSSPKMTDFVILDGLKLVKIV